MATKETALTKITELVTRFEEQVESYTKSDYNETLTRRDFIDPFFKALGWDIDNEQGFAEAYREVIHEDKVKVGKATKAPDYSFRIGGGKRLFFVEAKKPSVVIKDEITPAYQVRRYGWSAKLPISIITDFQEFAIYDCSKKPQLTDKASTARIKYITYKDYIKEFDFIYDTFSKEKVLKGSFDKFVQSDTYKKGTTTVDKEFLQSLDSWRTYLATSISWNNKDLDEDEINFAVQQTIDRIIFLRIAEDRSVEPYENLKHTIKQGDFYKNLFEQFRHADEKYNSGLFDFVKDKISKHLKIDNKVLKTIISELYYPESPYEFSVLSVEILGSAYEQFLGKVIRITPGHIAKVEEKPEVRKAGGVYYTPQYIVEYIVKNTVGKLIEGKKPKDIEKIKIVDPACGSGSFLIGAYQYLMDWHKNFYNNNGKPSKGKKDNPLTPEGNLTTSEKKRILINNIFGVDIDVNAVEVTKLSLLLKCMEGETEASIATQLRLFNERVLPTLDQNILSGNSLVDTDFYTGELDFGEEKKIKPFSWRKAFPEIFKNGGFDIAIGNPPYVRPHRMDEELKSYLWKHYKTFVAKSDLYSCFMERGNSICKEEGLFSFIVPQTWTSLESFEGIRKYVIENANIKLLTQLPKKVFQDATVETCIFVFEKMFDLKERKKNKVKVEQLNEKSEIKIIRTFQQSEIDNTHLHNFQLYGKSESKSLLEKFSKFDKLEKFVSFKYGFKTADDEKFLSASKQSAEYKPFIRSAAIKRYSNDKPTEYIWYRPEKMTAHRKTARPGEAARFENEKIIVSRMGKSVVATYDKGGLYVKDAMLLVKNSDLSLLYILGLLNSNLINYYYKEFFVTIDVLKNALLSIPIKSINGKSTTDKNLHDEIVKYVLQVLKLNEELQEIKLDSKIQQLQSKIDFLEEKINETVYKLYDLTEEEIKTVETK